MPRLAALDDASASVGLRARSWLAANCSQCHFGVGSGIRYPDLRFKTTMAASKLCEVINYASPPIIPGSSATSPIIVNRAGIRGAGQMPPLATLVVDQDAMTVLAAWIDAMDDAPPTLAPEYLCP